jgi:hypothetical protein
LLKIAGRVADENVVKRVPAPWLVAIVGASFLVRTVVAWLRTTPVFFPDEYIYAALGRSFAESGRPLIRGGSAHFPALLQPLLTAPAWLIGDVGVAYRLVQAIGALAMSLAAIPVYLLALRLGLSRRIALALAALAVLVPDLVYASFVASEPFAYPLVLAAVTAMVAALTRPTRRAQLAFVAFAVLAALARVQLAVLPAVFLGATLLTGLRERRTRAALREQLLPFALFAVPLVALLATGPVRALGPYRAVLGFNPDPIELVRWIGWDLMSLAYASGWVVVPGALIGLWLTLARPRSRPEIAFGATTVLLAVALLAEAGVLQSSLTKIGEIQERYVFYLVPLFGIAFALYAARGWPLRLPHLVLAAALVLLSVRVPLSGFAVAATLDASPILYGVYWLTQELGHASSAAVVIAASVGVLTVAGVAGSLRPRLGTPLALALAIFATAAASAGAVAFDVTSTSATKRTYLPADASFVDRSGLRHVALLQSWGGRRAPTLEHLFWNRSIDRVLLLPGAAPIDAFHSDRVTVAEDGALLVHGVQFRGPLLVDGYGSYVRVRNANLVAEGPVSALWAPTGAPRLELYAIGRYYDGWLADVGAVYLWPATAGAKLSGWLTMRLTAPDGPGVTLRFELPGGKKTSLRVPPGATRRLNVAVCSNNHDWYGTFNSDSSAFVGLRRVSVQATAPTFTPDPSACVARNAVS